MKQTEVIQPNLQTQVITPSQSYPKQQKKLPKCPSDHAKKYCKKSLASQMYVPVQKQKTVSLQQTQLTTQQSQATTNQPMPLTTQRPPLLTTQQNLTMRKSLNLPSFIPNRNLSSFLPNFEFQENTGTNQASYHPRPVSQNDFKQFGLLSTSANIPKRKAISATQSKPATNYSVPVYNVSAFSPVRPNNQNNPDQGSAHQSTFSQTQSPLINQMKAPVENVPMPVENVPMPVENVPMPAENVPMPAHHPKFGYRSTPPTGHNANQTEPFTQITSQVSNSGTCSQWQAPPSRQITSLTNNSTPSLIPRSSTVSLPAQIQTSRSTIDKKFSYGGSSTGQATGMSNQGPTSKPEYGGKSVLPDSRKTILVCRKYPTRFNLETGNQIQNSEDPKNWVLASKNQEPVFKIGDTPESYLKAQDMLEESPIHQVNPKLDQLPKVELSEPELNLTIEAFKDELCSSSDDLDLVIESNKDNVMENPEKRLNNSKSQGQMTNPKMNQCKSLFPDQATTQKILDMCSSTLQSSTEQFKADKVVNTESNSIKQLLTTPQGEFQSLKMTDHLNAKQVIEPHQHQRDQISQEQKPLTQNQQLHKRKYQDQNLPQGLLQPSTSKQAKFPNISKPQIGTAKMHTNKSSHPIHQTTSSAVAKSDNVKCQIALCCGYCSNFSLLLNNATWETAINHIMPMTNQELQTLFFTDLSDYFIRSTHVTIVGQNSSVCDVTGASVKISLSHSLLCRRTKREFFVNRFDLGYVLDLVLHVSKAHSGTVGVPK